MPECITNNSTNGKPIKYIPPARFGTETFFLLVFAFLLLSTIAFILLNNLEVCKKELAAATVIEGNEYYYENEDRQDVVTGEIPDNVLNISTFNYVKLLTAMFLIGFFGNGIFPGLQSYSSLPYGFLIYHLVASLASIGNAIGSFIAQFVPHTSIRILDFQIVIVIVIGVYIFYASAKSPFPPFLDTQFGPVFMVRKKQTLFRRRNIFLTVQFIFTCFFSSTDHKLDVLHRYSKLHENINCHHFSLSRR